MWRFWGYHYRNASNVRRYNEVRKYEMINTSLRVIKMFIRMTSVKKNIYSALDE